MGEVITFRSESLLDFIRREGPITTMAVGARFGWDTQTALVSLKELEKTGEIASEMSHWGGQGYAGGLCRIWFIRKTIGQPVR